MPDPGPQPRTMADRRIRGHRQPVPEPEGLARGSPPSVARSVRPADLHPQEPRESRSAYARHQVRLRRPRPVVAMKAATPLGLLRDPRPDPGRHPGGGQEGLPQARRKHHPDPCPGDPQAAARFIEITEAYDTLSDPDSREVYDRNYQPAPRHGHPRRRPSPRPPAACWPSWKTSGPRSAATIREIPPVVIIIASGTGGKQANGATTPPAAGTTAAPSTPKS